MAANQRYVYEFGSRTGAMVLWLLIIGLFVSLLFDVPGALLAVLAGGADWKVWAQLTGALMLGWGVFLYATNLYPNIETSREGMTVELTGGKRLIPWGDVLSLNEASRTGFKTWAVEVRGLGLLHRAYGILYMRKARPCVIIFSTLPEHKALIKEIEKHTEKR